eukprot:gene5727-6916_t
MAYLEARQSQESVPFLVILPLHSTVASQPSDCRLRENSKGYGGPKLAFMGDFDEVADLVPPLSGSTPSPSVEPIQQQMINMRKELLDSLKKDHAVARGVRYSEDGSEDTEVGGGVQQPSPLRPGFLSQLSSLQLAEPGAQPMDGLPQNHLSIRKLPVTQPAYQEAAGWLVDPFRIAVPPLSAAAVLAPASAAMHAHVESEMVRFQAWNGGPSFQGTPITFESLLDLPPVVMGLDELVTGTIDGLTVRDPASPSFPNRETVENYSGNSTDKASKAQMQRIMQSPTLGESSEYQYTPLQDRGGDLIQEGSSLRVKDKRIEEWERIRDIRIGVFAPDTVNYRSFIRTAMIIIARYEFLLELVDFIRNEYPQVPFEATYVLITSHYVTARWSKQPYNKAFSEDRDFLRTSFYFSSMSERRENLRRLVSEVFPHVEFNRILSRVGLLTAPGHSTPAQPLLFNNQPVLPPSVPLDSNPRAEPPRPCGLCGSRDHQYRVGCYTHPEAAAITRPCNCIKRLDGVKKKCVKLHAFTGPLGTPCEYTENL